MNESERLAAARSGDAQAFEELCAPLRREVQLHGYRILGSMSEADDQVQESLLRAWKSMKSFEGRSSFRAWLYKISTNICLSRLEGRQPRGLSWEAERSDPERPPPPPLDEAHWLEPTPGGRELGAMDPEARYSLEQSVNLAFLAALQRLPPRQRAVLILRDVVGWTAAEVAQLLEIGPAAVTSAHQRARATMDRDHDEPQRKLQRPTAEQRSSLLARYVEAWRRGDVADLVNLLKVDATVTMPPIPTRFVGPDAVAFLSRFILPPNAKKTFGLEPTVANGEDAFAAWERGPDGAWVPSGLHVLTFDGERLARIVAFMDGQVLARFGLDGPQKAAPAIHGHLAPSVG